MVGLHILGSLWIRPSKRETRELAFNISVSCDFLFYSSMKFGKFWFTVITKLIRSQLDCRTSKNSDFKVLLWDAESAPLKARETFQSIAQTIWMFFLGLKVLTSMIDLDSGLSITQWQLSTPILSDHKDLKFASGQLASGGSPKTDKDRVHMLLENFIILKIKKRVEAVRSVDALLFRILYSLS